MAKSNAERQREYRQRAAEALRAVRALADAGVETETVPPPAPTPIPQYLWDEGKEDLRDPGDPEDERYTVEEIRADIAEHVLSIIAAMEQAGIRFNDDFADDSHGYVTLLGGKKYLEAITQWDAEQSRRRGKRRQEVRDRAPAIPGEDDVA